MHTPFNRLLFNRLHILQLSSNFKKIDNWKMSKEKAGVHFKDNCYYLGCILSFKTFAPISRPPKAALVI